MSGPGLFGGGQIVSANCSSQVSPLSQQAMHNYYDQQCQAAAMNKWMFDGITMDINQFADQVFGDDTPEKTLFLLKHKNNNN